MGLAPVFSAVAPVFPAASLMAPSVVLPAAVSLWAAADAFLSDAALEALEAELFLSSAPGERLERWELLLRPQASEASLEERRRALVQAFSAWNRPANLEAMQDLLAAAGVRGSLREEDGKLLVALEEYQGVTAQEAQRMLDRLLPAHLEWEIQAR